MFNIQKTEISQNLPTGKPKPFASISQFPALKRGVNCFIELMKNQTVSTGTAIVLLDIPIFQFSIFHYQLRLKPLMYFSSLFVA